MKKLFTLTATLFLAIGCFAQYCLTYDANNLRIGDYRSMKQIEYQEQGNAGANQIWDFSKSKIIKDMYINQEEDLSATPSSNGYNLSCDEGGQKNTFFEITKSEKRYFGLQSKNVKIEFKEPIVDLMFPFAYNDIKTGIMDGTYKSGEVTSYINGSYVTSADAWGTLILPDGNVYYNTLRVKVEKNYTQTFGNSNYQIQTVRYQYFTKGARYPVLIAVESLMTSDSNCKCGNGKTAEMYMETPAVYENDAEKFFSKKAKSEITDFHYLATPNPFSEELNVSFSLSSEADITIELLDMNGKMIEPLMNEKVEAGQYSRNFNTSSLIAGKYALRIQVNGKTYTNKLLKAK